MLKTPEQILDEIKKTFEVARNEFSEFLSNPVKETSFETSFVLFLRTRRNPQILEKIKDDIVTWIDEALAQNKIEGWKDFYARWNGDSDISKDKYNGKEDIAGRLSDLRIFLERWEIASYQQKLRDGLQAAGINPDDEDMLKKAEELKKIQDDLTALGIDKTKVKETIEGERKELEQHKEENSWLANNYLGKMWEEIKIEIEAQIEVKKN